MTRSLNHGRARAVFGAVTVGPVIIIFLSSNFVNAGNLLFNILFSRWMGPEMFGELATLLTIKLAVLGVCGAVQMAVSHRIAQTQARAAAPLELALSRLNRICFVALWFALPVVLAVLWLSTLHEALGINSPVALVFLALSLPFAVPLSVLRGVALGRLDTRRILMSANYEMAVRLLGSIVAWHAGLGLTGVIAAVAVSVAAGWVPLRGALTLASRRDTPWRNVGRAIAAASVPFALLQAGQVILLDGDVILAKLFLSDAEAGYVAVLSLFQRIQFFACFGLAAVLLPAVTRAVTEGQSAVRQVMAVAALFVVVSAVVLYGAAVFPSQVVTLSVGQAFRPVAPHLLLAIAASVAFTLSYLLATFLLAIGDRKGIWLVTLACPVQLLAMTIGAESLSQMLFFKLGCQLLLSAALVSRAVGRNVQRAAPPLPLTAV